MLMVVAHFRTQIYDLANFELIQVIQPEADLQCTEHKHSCVIVSIGQPSSFFAVVSVSVCPVYTPMI